MMLTCCASAQRRTQALRQSRPRPPMRRRQSPTLMRKSYQDSGCRLAPALPLAELLQRGWRGWRCWRWSSLATQKNQVRPAPAAAPGALRAATASHRWQRKRAQQERGQQSMPLQAMAMPMTRMHWRVAWSWRAGRQGQIEWPPCCPWQSSRAAARRTAARCGTPCRARRHRRTGEGRGTALPPRSLQTIDLPRSRRGSRAWPPAPGRSATPRRTWGTRLPGRRSRGR